MLADKLKKLLKEIKKGKGKKDGPKTAASAKDGRVPLGFSLRLTDHQPETWTKTSVQGMQVDASITNTRRRQATSMTPLTNSIARLPACGACQAKHHLAAFLCYLDVT